MTTNREIIETWFRRVWNEEDTKAIDELFVVDGEVRGLGENSLIGPMDFKIFSRHFVRGDIRHSHNRGQEHRRERLDLGGVHT